MKEELLIKLIKNEFNKLPESIERCMIGHGNYVYFFKCKDGKYIIRLNENQDQYSNSKYWLNLLSNINIPVPKVILSGKYNKYSYIIIEYIDGKDLGIVYDNLTDKDKRNIAKQIVKIQEKVSELPKNNRFGSIDMYNDESGEKTWKEYIVSNLERSKERIKKNKIFDVNKVEKLEELLNRYNNYFERIEPKAFLDDISSKNLLIKDGSIAGIVDIDWLGFGDELLYVALTKMALLDMGTDTKYVDYIMIEMNLDDFQKEVVAFYTLLFCVDFMGEKGHKFNDKVIYVDEKVVEKLNSIYEYGYEKLLMKIKRNINE